MPFPYLNYRLLIIILCPVILGHILWVSIRNKESRYFLQRTGFGYTQLAEKKLWFHCASVGEVNTLMPLLKSLHENNKQLKIIITTNTVTGSKIVAQQNLDYLEHAYLPFDWPCAVKRFISQLKPASLFVMETEIWPVLFTCCKSSDIPVRIINARLSAKTTSANKWIQSLLKYSLSRVTAIFTRSQDNTLAYLKLGADQSIVSTIGNLKYTTALHTGQVSKGAAFNINRQYILVASTHNDEESQIYNCWKELERNELLVIAPRHPERSAAIIKQLNNDLIAVRSKNQEITHATEVYLLDTIGELKNLYAGASAVIMGGSFTPTGGHNILEPASFNRAIITGPHMENFKEELELMLSNNAIIQVATYTELKQELNKLLNNDSYRNTLQENTEKLVHNAESVLQDYTRLIISTCRA